MKVIHIVASIDKSAGGPSRSVPQTSEQLAELGVDIELITRCTKKVLKVNTSANLILSFRSYLKLFFSGFLLLEKDVSIVHLQHIWNPYIHIMAWNSRRKGVPYLISTRGMLETWIMKRHPLRKRLGLFFYQRNDINKAAVLHATSELEKNSIRKLGFKNPIAIIPNGVNLSIVTSPKEIFKKKRIIFLSRIHKKKGIEVLLDAWKLINTVGWELLIAGEGERSYVQELKDRLKNIQLSNVQFTGAKYNNEKWDFIRSGDVFVLPSYSENFGNVVIEALAMGVPVIATKNTPWEELETYRCGWWIDLSIQNLAKALTEAMSSSPASLQEMGLRGRKLIWENYDISGVGKNMYKLYQWMVGKQPKPDFVNTMQDDKGLSTSRINPTTEKKLKVIYFITSIDRKSGGITAYLQLLLNKLSKSVDTVIVTTLTDEPVSFDHTNVRYINLMLINYLAMNSEFKKLLLREKPDIVHINGIWQPQTWWFQRVAMKLGIKIVLSPHGMMEPWILNHNRWKKQLALPLYQRRAFEKANYLHATAASEKENLEKLGFIKPIRVIANGIELEEAKLKEDWTPRKKLLFLSRIHVKKGIEHLIEAITILKNEFAGGEVIIAGEGEESYIDSLKQKVKKNGVEHIIQFVGGVYGETKWKLMSEADVFVLPTYSENFGIVVVEALACGTPVITTFGTPWQELETEGCGWWIEIGTESLVTALKEYLLLDAAQLEKMGKQGAELVKRKYSSQKMADDMLDFYKEVLSQKLIKTSNIYE